MKWVHRIPAKVIWLLHDRGVRVEDLALLVQSSRPHVTMVMANRPGRGHQTRSKLVKHLTAAERELLGWGPRGELLPVESSIKTYEKRNHSAARAEVHSPAKSQPG